MYTIHVDPLTMTDQLAEPVSVGLPFARGALTDASCLRILAGDRPLPVQTRVLTRWSDDSIRWVLALFQPDLSANTAESFVLDLGGSVGIPLATKVLVCDRTDGWTVDTGPLRVTISRPRFDLFREVQLHGRTILGAGALHGGFFYQAADVRHDLAGGLITDAEWIERGPLRALLQVRGRHSGSDGLGFRISAEFHAGKPWVRVQYQIIMDRPTPQVEIASWGLRITPPGTAERCEVALGNYHSESVPGNAADPKRQKINAETILYTAFESIPESYCSNFWADWNCSAIGGVTLSLFQAMQNFPKAMASTPGGLELDLLPSDEPPLRLRRGVAKTHSLQLHFHAPDEPLLSLNLRSFLFQVPRRARLETGVYAGANAFTAPLPARRVDRLDCWLHQRAGSVPRAFGMLHWGDYVEASYTDQGRGGGRPIWCNGEYDPSHVYYLLHALLGERWLGDYAATTARHGMDVDLVHDSDDPLRQGGQVTHSADHVTGVVQISHEWVTGLLDHYHFTGEPEAREAALAIGENILRHLDQPAYRENPTLTSTRSMGWALRSLGPLWLETGDDRFRKAARSIADTFLAWTDGLGSMADTYTEHCRARVPFMIGLTCESLRQWAAISGDERIGGLIVRQARDLLQNAVGLGGIMYYKEPPFLHLREPQLIALPTFVEAFRLTGERAFLPTAYRIVESTLDAGIPGRKQVAGKTRFEDAVLLDGVSWASSALEPLLYFYAVLAERKDSQGRPLLDGLDFRRDF